MPSTLLRSRVWTGQALKGMDMTLGGCQASRYTWVMELPASGRGPWSAVECLARGDLTRPRSAPHTAAAARRPTRNSGQAVSWTSSHRVSHLRMRASSVRTQFGLNSLALWWQQQRMPSRKPIVSKPTLHATIPTCFSSSSQPTIATKVTMSQDQTSTHVQIDRLVVCLWLTAGTLVSVTSSPRLQISVRNHRVPMLLYREPCQVMTYGHILHTHRFHASAHFSYCSFGLSVKCLSCSTLGTTICPRLHAGIGCYQR